VLEAARPCAARTTARVRLKDGHLVDVVVPLLPSRLLAITARTQAGERTLVELGMGTRATALCGWYASARISHLPENEPFWLSTMRTDVVE
jgi:hypothetical protein